MGTGDHLDRNMWLSKITDERPMFDRANLTIGRRQSTVAVSSRQAGIDR